MSAPVRATALVVACVLLSCAPRGGEQVSTDIEFCQLEVPEITLRVNGAFPVEFMFTVRGGRPTGFRHTPNPYYEEAKQAEACINRWRLGFVPDGTEVVARFNWRHAIGWESIDLTWPGNSLRVGLSGKNPYER